MFPAAVESFRARPDGESECAGAGSAGGGQEEGSSGATGALVSSPAARTELLLRRRRLSRAQIQGRHRAPGTTSNFVVQTVKLPILISRACTVESIEVIFCSFEFKLAIPLKSTETLEPLSI